MQGTIIITTTITKAVSGPVKGDPRNNDQVKFVDRDKGLPLGFRDTKGTRNQLSQVMHLDKIKVVAINSRKGERLSFIENLTGDPVCVDLIIDSTIKGYACRSLQCPRIDKLLLDLIAEFGTNLNR
jgi:hypothetical protein